MDVALSASVWNAYMDRPHKQKPRKAKPSTPTKKPGFLGSIRNAFASPRRDGGLLNLRTWTSPARKGSLPSQSAGPSSPGQTTLESGGNDNPFWPPCPSSPSAIEETVLGVPPSVSAANPERPEPDDDWENIDGDTDEENPGSDSQKKSKAAVNNTIVR